MRAGLETDFFKLSPPRIIAHRGGGGRHPENTLAAFAASHAGGVRYFELDIHTTRDGVLVVCHDSTLTRTTDLTAAIADLTFEELVRADAGYRFTADGAFPFRGLGIRVPRLAEVLSAFDDCFFVVEIKPVEPDLTEALLAILSAAGVMRRVLIASEHQPPLVRLRAAAPQVPTGFCTPEVMAFLQACAGAERGYLAPGDAIQVPPEHEGLRLVTPQTLAAAHELGLEMHVWTINEQAAMAELLALGVDGIITDFPDRLMELIRR